MKLWFDTDPGVDDALALALIARSPAFELVGLSTVFGNADVRTTTANALGLCALLGLDVPVHAGAAGPLQGSPRLAPEVHGGDGLGGHAASLPAPRRQAEQMPAAEAIIRAARKEPDLHLAAVGPFTNLAQALRLDPDLPQRLASVTLMGGAFGLHGQGGNVTPNAEANVFNDARAADEVFAAPWRRLHVVGLDATQRVRMPRAALAALADGDAVARLLHRAAMPYIDFYHRHYGQEVLVAHDAIALMPLLAPTTLQWRQGPVRVVEGGLAHGQTTQDWQRLGGADWRDLPEHAVAVDANAPAITELCLRAWLNQGERT
ncbi:MAG: nucleoside hydrolase [Burkholderiales bacterium]|nr:nucleoside hydrolase [Burkholderiales bacterium]